MFLSKLSLTSLIALMACTHADIPEYLELDGQGLVEESVKKSSFEQQLAKLDSIAVAGSPEAESVLDVRFILLAQIAERNGKRNVALQHWFEAAKSADKRFGKQPFERWIRAFAKTIENPLDAAVLARLILAETNQGEKIPYMMDRKLNAPVALIKRLRALIPEIIAPDADTSIQETVVAALAPTKMGIPPQDALLTSLAQRYCKISPPIDDSWMRWERSLDRMTFNYWRALVADCGGDTKAAIAAYGILVPKIVADIAQGSRAVYAAGRLAALQRAAGDRQKAADAFSALMVAYDLPSVSAVDFGDSASEFQLRRINDTLWAGRYRTLVGDNENAENYAKRAIDLLDDRRYQFSTLTGNAAAKVSEYRAEAVQILAFRVALEKKNFEQAENLVRNALSSNDLTREWRDRFTWSLGLYLYLRGDFANSKATWEQMLSEISSEEYRPRLLFWISRAYFGLGQNAEGKFYLKSLGEEYPFHYYSVAGPIAAGLDVETNWQRLLGKPWELVKKFKEQRDFDTLPWRNDSNVGPLLRRTEVLVAAGLNVHAISSARELETAVRKRYTLGASITRFIYLSRLLSEAGDYHRAIWLTTELSKEFEKLWSQYPEQVLVAFPRPYQELFESASQEQDFALTHLVAVARQESSFRPAVASGAGAIGMMQVLPSTAERVNSQAKLKIDEIRLVDPKINIRIGTAYLKQLSNRYKGFQPAIYAAYNAGEFAADGWLERRFQSDTALWNELIPFKETNDYVKNVWRNELIYRYLATPKD